MTEATLSACRANKFQKTKTSWPCCAADAADPLSARVHQSCHCGSAARKVDRKLDAADATTGDGGGIYAD